MKRMTIPAESTVKIRVKIRVKTRAKLSQKLPQSLTALLKPSLYCAMVLLAACEAGVVKPMSEAVTVPLPASMAKMTVAESPAMAMDMLPPPARIVVGRRKPARAVRQGVITAGDIDDTLNVGAFNRYLTKAARTTKLPKTDFSRPVLLQLIGADGKTAPGVYVTLRKSGAAEPFYTGYSGVDGNITVFPAVMGAGRVSNVELRAFPDGQQQGFVQKIARTGRRQQVRLPFAADWKPEFLDLAFVVDTTGSMSDELNWLTRELSGIVKAARRSAPGVSIRYGLIVYRDQGDDYVVRNYGFTKQQSQMQGWLRDQNAAGGGDYPEAAADALAAGAALNWRRGKGERLMFHIADAPPHDRDARAYLAAAKSAARQNVQIFGLGASGVAAESEYLMRQAALQTGGRYLFLTDDSGVGRGHAEPTIACYRVSKLKNLMVRVLRSELSGHRIEAKRANVVRSVGRYQAGVCQN